MSQKVTQNKASISSLTSKCNLDLSAMAAKLRKQESDYSTLRARVEVGAGETPGAPSTTTSTSLTLPAAEPNNPWCHTSIAPIHDDQIYFEGLGYRPISDFVQFPPEAPITNCFLRLSPSASVREDKVPKEAVIFPREEAQKLFMAAMKEMSCINTKQLPFKGIYTMFATTPEMANPLSSKILEETHTAVLEGRPLPSMRELEQTSLLLPGTSEGWQEVYATFKAGKLTADCASEQFKEALPKLRDYQIDAEFKARSKLADSLHACTFLELLISANDDWEIIKVLAKPLLRILQRDLYDFIVARRICRKQVLDMANIKHETNRLIDGNIWGEHLFPDDLVQETLDMAVKANHNLRTRWDLQFKRKWEEGKGPMPKNKRFRKNKGLAAPPPPPPAAVAAPAGPSVAQPFIMVPNPNYVQSPAYNPSYDRGSAFPAYSQHRRGGRGPRGGRGKQLLRGGYNNTNQAAGRGRSSPRGPRGPRGARGAPPSRRQ